MFMQIEFFPPFSRIAKLVANTLNNILDRMKLFPRITEKFNLRHESVKDCSTVYANDETFHRMQQSLNSGKLFFMMIRKVGELLGGSRCPINLDISNFQERLFRKY